MKDPTTYDELLAILNGHRSAKLANNTYVMHGPERDTLVIMLHGTSILTFDSPLHTTAGNLGSLIVPYTGGWNTLTTVQRLNRYTPERFTFRRVEYGTHTTVTDEGGPTVQLEHVLYLDPEAMPGEGIIERMDQ